jgi:hypothetical protein
MLKLFLLTLILWNTASFFPPKGIDFDNKSLLKELQKLSGTDKPERKEIQVPEALLVNSMTIRGKFYELLEAGNSSAKKYIYVGRVNGCREGGCSNSSESSLVETPEYFDYLIIFEPNLSVQQVKVYNYQASHGQEVTNKGWLKQFQGYDGSRSLTVGKSIDAISGATISVFGITNDVQEKTRLLKKLVSGTN